MSASTHLLRDLAPIPARAWKTIDDEARERLTPLLAARRLVDWSGAGGWDKSAVSLGRADTLEGPPAGIDAADARLRRRRVQPLAEVRVPFTVSLDEIQDIQRGTDAPDLDDLARAARAIAEIENRTVFHGWPAAGITGISEASAYPSTELGTDCDAYPGIVAAAVDRLRCGGIDGPYVLAIGPEGYTRIVQTAEHGGHLLFDHLKQVTDGPILWAPGVQGAIVASRRGGDFSLDVGQDIAVGYHHHDADTVHLYLEESFTFRVLEPDAATTLT